MWTGSKLHENQKLRRSNSKVRRWGFTFRRCCWNSWSVTDWFWKRVVCVFFSFFQWRKQLDPGSSLPRLPLQDVCSAGLPLFQRPVWHQTRRLPGETKNLPRTSQGIWIFNGSFKTLSLDGCYIQLSLERTLMVKTQSVMHELSLNLER